MKIVSPKKLPRNSWKVRAEVGKFWSRMSLIPRLLLERHDLWKTTCDMWTGKPFKNVSIKRNGKLIGSCYLKNMRPSNWITSPGIGMKIQIFWVATTVSKQCFGIRTPSWHNSFLSTWPMVPCNPFERWSKLTSDIPWNTGWLIGILILDIGIPT